MKRKKSVTNLDQRLITMLENAYYQVSIKFTSIATIADSRKQCDPPDRPVIVPKVRPPMQLFIRHLLYDVLEKATLDKVVRLLRKMDWQNLVILRKLHNAFTKVWKIKFSNVYLLAILLHDLARHHSEFCISIVDSVLENIQAGMEVWHF